MFDQSFVQNDPQTARRSYTLLFSTLLQTSALCLLVGRPSD